MYLFISGTWQLLGLNSAHPVVNDLIPSALLFDPGSLILEPEATYGRPSPEAVEVTSRSLDVTQAAGFFVIIEAEFSAKAGYDRRRPNLSYDCSREAKYPSFGSQTIGLDSLS